MFRAPSALLPSGTGHVLGFSTAQRNCLQLVFRGQGASSGHIKNYEMRCAPSSRTLNCNIFSVAVTKGFHYAFSLPALGTGTREVCIFYGFLSAPTKPGNKCFPLDGETGQVRAQVGRDTFHYISLSWGFPRGSEVKNLPSNARDMGSSPGSGRSPEEGNGYPLQYSCLGKPMDRGAWRATDHGVTKESDTT